MKEYWVEYEYIETAYGKRPNRIKVCKTREDAENFLRLTKDGNLVEVEILNQ